MKRRLPVIALAAAMLVIGATAAVAAVNWPASCNGWSCANSHMNDLYGRVNTVNDKVNTVNGKVNELNRRLALTDEKTVVRVEPYVFDLTAPESIPFIEEMATCGTPDPGDDRPFYGYAISGGITIGGEGAEDWHIVSSGPPNMMNSWPVVASNPDWVEGDPLPDVSTFAICLAI